MRPPRRWITATATSPTAQWRTSEHSANLAIPKKRFAVTAASGGPRADAMSETALHNVARLREAARRLESGEPINELGPWLADALNDYLKHAAQGVTLEAALDIDPGSVRDPRRAHSGLDERDAAIRRLADEHFAGLEIEPTARAILSEARRYRAGRWRLECDRDAPPAEHQGTTTELLWRAFHAAAEKFPHSTRQLRRIIRGERD